MTFEEWWNQYGNANGDSVTLGMVQKYGIKSIKILAENAWLFSEQNTSQRTVQVGDWCGSATCPNNKGDCGSDELCTCKAS